MTRGPNVWQTDVDNYGSVQMQSLDANPTNVYVDSSAAWKGYMNVFNKPQDGGAYQFGSGVGDGGSLCRVQPIGLVLSPNTIGDPNSYWYTPAGGPGSVGNKSMDASMYVEIGSLPGRKLTFSGTVLSNTLVSASNTNALGNGWTSVAFIKDFAPDYSSVKADYRAAHARAVQHQPQHGQRSGPARAVWLRNRGAERVGHGCGSIRQIVIGKRGHPARRRITPSRNGGNINLTFPTQLGKTYTVQYKSLLTDPAWSTLTTTNGTGSNAVISDPVTSQRYYRLSIQ